MSLFYSYILHCVKRVRIRSYSGPHFYRIFPHSDCIRRDTPYSVRMRENAVKIADQNNSEYYLSIFSPNAGKCGKNTDQNNSEYGLFLRSVRVYYGIKNSFQSEQFRILPFYRKYSSKVSTHPF